LPSGYDKAGNVLYVEEQYGQQDVKDRSVTNTYDHTYRLDVETIAETGGSTTVTDYGYDKANNRTGKTVTVDQGTPTVWTFLYGPFGATHNSNQLRSANDGTTTTTFLYDANGNRSEKLVGGVTTQTYTWDHENRLKQVVDSSLGTFEYAYDHRTRRVVRDESLASGQSPELSFSGGLSVQEYVTGSQIPAAELIRGSDYGGGIGGVLYTIRGSARSFNAYNSRGDVVSQTDPDGEIAWQASYEAFGKRTQQQGATLDRQRANTKDEDPWGGLNEGLRYRDLEFAVFLSRDPAGFVDGPNVYTYVRQNPWTAFDPLGLSETWPWQWGSTGFWGKTLTVVSAPVHAIFDVTAVSLGEPIAEFGGALVDTQNSALEAGNRTANLDATRDDFEQQVADVKAAKLRAAANAATALENGAQLPNTTLTGPATSSSSRLAVRPTPFSNASKGITGRINALAKTFEVEQLPNGATKIFDSGTNSSITARMVTENTLEVVNVEVKKSVQGTKYGQALYRRMLETFPDATRVRGIPAKDNASALAKSGGDIAETPRAKILTREGFQSHRMEGEFMVSEKSAER
jgi:RHS repeat-associated protein